jgi:HAMP domain-containing protein
VKGISVASAIQPIVRFLRDNWVSLLIVIGLPLAWFALRSTGTPLGSAADFQRQVQAGQPTIVDFFSNG